ncbi:abortive phage infection protein [Streptomyces sp. NPDC050433]|uniref:abortive phage infection protein n=1 Tax=unclassified Streptomyces TaxID=2593676 RepID=UPI003412899B
MVRGEGISRARFLGGAAAVGVAGVAGAFAAGRAGAAQEPAARRGRPGGGVRYRGVMYEVITGESPATSWNAERMRADLRAVRNDLDADTVSVFGDGVDRLGATASEAAERGLNVWLQPRLADRPHSEILDHLAATGEHAERLRRQGADVHLSVGCEFVLFVPGIVPGDDALERIKNLLAGTYDPELMRRRLAAFISRAAKVGRSVFQGRLSYGAAHEDEVDWDLFDFVSVNYYSYFPRRAGYVAELTPYLRWGKPVAITECGSCTYLGAPEAGGMGWDVVDHEKGEIKGNLVRSERAQAAYLSDVLGVFESMNLYASLVYGFVTPDAPHRPDDPRRDLDMASYSLTKTLKDDPDDPDSDWHWEPKKSFHAVARHYGRGRISAAS